MNSNPFSASFGKIPNHTIGRYEQINEIVDDFESDRPQSNLYIITGPRGCGKTISLISLKRHFDEKDDWITARLNPSLDLLEQMASSIYEQGKMKSSFTEKEFGFSFSGISISLAGKTPVSSITTLLDKIFQLLKKKKKKVLVLIDEIVPNEQVKAFAQEFQILIGENYDLFLIMTGLYQNISDLQNDKSLTFLYRAPKIALNPLNLRAISLSYSEVFRISIEESLKLAKTTGGFAFAYQLLGSLLYEHKKSAADAKIIKEYDLVLDEMVYSKIFSELTCKEKDLLIAIANGNDTNQKVMEALKMTGGGLAIYKKRLADKGLIDRSSRHDLKFMLPRFKEFLKFKEMEMSE